MKKLYVSFMNKLGAMFLALFLVVNSCPNVLAATSTTEVVVMNKVNPFANKLYDASIKRWTMVYTPEIPWTWHKAQLIAESGLNPNAVSPVGAQGLAQFMPGTWADTTRKIGVVGTPFTPALAVQGQIYYMGELLSQFKRERPVYDRYSLALASYNAGLGNVLRAQRLGGGGLLYEPMAAALPRVTGKEHASETTGYVSRIWGYIGILRRLEGEQ